MHMVVDSLSISLLGFGASGSAGDFVLCSDSPGGGSPAEDRGEGRSHHLHRAGCGRRGRDTRGAHGQERTIPSVERGAVLWRQLREAQHCL